MAIKIIPVIPKKIIRLPVEEMVTRAKKTVKEESDIHRRMFDKFTKTWSVGNKPLWDQGVIDTGHSFEVRLSTISTPFVFIEKGTLVRYRRMSPDFVPKTKPRVIGSGAGSGRALGFATRPGIKARDIRVEIAKRRQGPFAKKMVAAMRIQPSALTASLPSNFPRT